MTSFYGVTLAKVKRPAGRTEKKREPAPPQPPARPVPSGIITKLVMSASKVTVRMNS